MDLFVNLRKKAVSSPRRVVFPEGDDLRILEASCFIRDNGLGFPVILRGRRARQLFEEKGWSQDGVEFIDVFPKDDYVDLLLEKRKHKGLSRGEALELLGDVNYQGVLLVESGFVDAMVSGAVSSSASVLRPALQIIKTAEGVRRASSYFLMVKDGRVFFFADCAFIVEPCASDLRDIALSTARSAVSLGFQPRVALLSFSSKGSAEHDSLEKIREALSLIRKEDSSLVVDGELQLDSAIVPSVAKLKCPGSPIQGDANVLVFPDLNSGNIGYKLVQRLGGFSAFGPVVQGLRKPVNDLSRGCSVEDIVNVFLLTVNEVRG